MSQSPVTANTGTSAEATSPVAKDVDGAANVITAAICTLAHGQPGGVCHSAGVKAAAGSL